MSVLMTDQVRVAFASARENAMWPAGVLRDDPSSTAQGSTPAKAPGLVVQTSFEVEDFADDPWPEVPDTPDSYFLGPWHQLPDPVWHQLTGPVQRDVYPSAESESHSAGSSVKGGSSLEGLGGIDSRQFLAAGAVPEIVQPLEQGGVSLETLGCIDYWQGTYGCGTDGQGPGYEPDGRTQLEEMLPHSQQLLPMYDQQNTGCVMMPDPSGVEGMDYGMPANKTYEQVWWEPQAMPVQEMSSYVQPAKAPDLAAIRTQIEYYFSTENLKRDNFFQKNMSENHGWLDMCLIQNCNKIKAFDVSDVLLVEALRESYLRTEFWEGRYWVRRAPLLQALDASLAASKRVQPDDAKQAEMAHAVTTAAVTGQKKAEEKDSGPTAQFTEQVKRAAGLARKKAPRPTVQFTEQVKDRAPLCSDFSKVGCYSKSLRMDACGCGEWQFPNPHWHCPQKMDFRCNVCEPCALHERLHCVLCVKKCNEPCVLHEILDCTVCVKRCNLSKSFCGRAKVLLFAGEKADQVQVEVWAGEPHNSHKLGFLSPGQLPIVARPAQMIKDDEKKPVNFPRFIQIKIKPTEIGLESVASVPKANLIPGPCIKGEKKPDKVIGYFEEGRLGRSCPMCHHNPEMDQRRSSGKTKGLETAETFPEL
jgi:hypothetical protein